MPDDSYPDYPKQWQNIKFDKPLLDYMKTCGGNVSGLVNRLMWDSLDHEIPEDGPETMSPNVRKRILRIQLEAMKKEKLEMELMIERIEKTLNEMEESPDKVWKRDVAKVLKNHRYAHRGSVELVADSDPDPEEDEDGEE